MAELKIPNLNKKSDKYFFKKKLTLRRKSRGKLIKESFLMLFLSTLIIYINYLIPEKKLIFDNFFANFGKLIIPLIDIISYLYEICLSLFIILSSILSVILILGAFLRISRVIKRKTKQI